MKMGSNTTVNIEKNSNASNQNVTPEYEAIIVGTGFGGSVRSDDLAGVVTTRFHRSATAQGA